MTGETTFEGTAEDPGLLVDLVVEGELTMPPANVRPSKKPKSKSAGDGGVKTTLVIATACAGAGKAARATT
jgi:hypothetical protein